MIISLQKTSATDLPFKGEEGLKRPSLKRNLGKCD